MTETRKLVSIDITTGGNIYSRTLYTDYIPTNEDLYYYYKILCGFSDAVIASTIIEVPADFNTALLSFSEQIPTRFPNYDITAPIADAEKIAKYHDYILQLSEMERARAALNVHIHVSAAAASAAAAAPVQAADDAPRKRRFIKKHAWVREILETLESDEIPPAGDELVPVEMDDLIPHAWILTPVVYSVREQQGSRILLDPKRGKYWECLLGSSVFPDFVVSRRISTRNWIFQHKTAEDLLDATLDFYIASQDSTVVDGLSGWIPVADKEIAALITAFKRVKVNERVMTENVADPMHVYSILNTIELRCLASKLTNPEIHGLSFDIFNKYFNYLAQAIGIPPENYQNIEGVKQVLRRWERGGLGFRPDADPIVEPWIPMWRLVMRSNPTAERVSLFLLTLDCWSPLSAHVMSSSLRQEIASQWTNIYIDTELILDAKASEAVVVVYDETRRWCLKYLPVEAFDLLLRKEKVAPEYDRRGFQKVKPYTTRIMKGVRFRNSPNTVAVSGKAVNKDEAPPPKVKPKQIRVYIPEQPVTVTANGKVRGRPPRPGSAAATAREKVAVAAGEISVPSPPSEETDAKSNLSSNAGDGDGEETNELIMNLGSV
jgi:hypothetical protein